MREKSNHANHSIPFENHENHENHRIQYENHENHEKIEFRSKIMKIMKNKIAFQNYEIIENL